MATYRAVSGSQIIARSLHQGHIIHERNYRVTDGTLAPTAPSESQTRLLGTILAPTGLT